MIETAFTRLVGIEHPVVCGGMGSGMSDGGLTGAVSQAGGLGVIGASWLSPDEVAEMAARTRELTAKPFGVNLLLFGAEDLLDAALAAEPAVLSTAWARQDQDLAAIFARAHESGAKVMHMVARLDEAERAAEAGADVIVAQGSEGGGHVGEMGTTGDRAPGREGSGSAAGRRRRRLRRRRRACRRARARRGGRPARHDVPRHAGEPGAGLVQAGDPRQRRPRHGRHHRRRHVQRPRLARRLGACAAYADDRGVARPRARASPPARRGPRRARGGVGERAAVPGPDLDRPVGGARR